MKRKIFSAVVSVVAVGNLAAMPPVSAAAISPARTSDWSVSLTEVSPCVFKATVTWAAVEGATSIHLQIGMDEVGYPQLPEKNKTIRGGAGSMTLRYRAVPTTDATTHSFVAWGVQSSATDTIHFTSSYVWDVQCTIVE